ncbi:MAG TPA: DUF4301 family protein [bacterium]|nr:DUF4301 family protein [bacterium]
MVTISWTAADLKQMKALGVNPREASRQIGLFQNPPPFAELVRPATLGDGIRRLNPSQKKKALAKYKQASGQGRFYKFVPASGAASRMFHLLMKFFQRESFSEADLKREALGGMEESRQFLEFMDALSRFAFFDELGRVLSKRDQDLEALRREGRFQDILRALLLPEGLNYSQKPKGLIRFHGYASGERTPLEEQLVEGVQYVQDRSKRCRIHFTVSEEHEEACRGHFLTVREKYEKKYGVKFDLGFSVQGAETNTLAADKDNRPFRAKDGRLVFRPAGHGALLENLNRLKGDLVYIKNIDNVTLEHRLETTVIWKKILGGYLAGIQEDVFKTLKKLSAQKVLPKTIQEIAGFAKRELGLDLGEDFGVLAAPAKVRRLKALLNRPIRVCGVVPAQGEPGGGPYWMKDSDGNVSLQIVEKAQMDLGRNDQKKIFESSTHFNPVDLVCGVRDWKGKPFNLKKYRDPNAVFISSKSMEGKELKALELPGLWNGAMAHWITLFVEVPLETFNPVKTVLDLLKPAHQASHSLK